ncbi:NAD(P)-dependent oxidoreductase [Bacillus sp. SD075]|uniref:NAD(P)-dependent oxidoreductase n=1 Tax=Bacillus sp. SD075 TaxID=2781732 RepID=UPI002868040F|nr:NAD(P)-dependent oxidoreductase [Bacillus sp. SD075]
MKSLGYEVSLWESELEPLPEELLDSEVVVCNGLFLYNDISKFSKLKLVQLTSAGLDRVPINEIRNREIKLLNARDVYSIPMSEWVILKILEIYKNTRFFERAQSRCEWVKNRELLELNGKTVGIIGTGSVGIEVAKRVKAFGCKVLGLNTSGSNNKYFDDCMSVNNITRFLGQIDIVVLTLPLTDKTLNMINQETLNSMKDDSVLINVSRGGIVSENDLLRCLNNGKIRGAALDVFDEEPLSKNSVLWKHPRVVVTPHNSFVSDNVSGRMFKLIYGNLERFINKRPLKHI